MDTRETQIEAVSAVVRRWTPPAELELAGPDGTIRIRRIAEEMIAAVKRVDDGLARPPSQELLDLHEEIREITADLEQTRQELDQARMAHTKATKDVEEARSQVEFSDQTRRRIEAASEQEVQRAREEIAARDAQMKDYNERLDLSEQDRSFYHARSLALEASLDRLLTRAEMITQRKPIEDWNETMQEARHTLGNGVVAA